MKKVTTFYDLEVWKCARSLRNTVSAIVSTFPKEEKYRLSDQVLRSSRSITANIAEGFGRYHYKEAIQYYRQSRGSLTETADHLICAYDQRYITKGQLQELLSSIDVCGKLLNGLIRSQSTNAK